MKKVIIKVLVIIMFAITIYLCVKPRPQIRDMNEQIINENDTTVYSGVICESINHLMVTSIEEEKQPETQESALWHEGWTTCALNVRLEPSVDSQILDTLVFNTKLSFFDYNDEWVSIKYNDNLAYVKSEYISNEECKSQVYQVPDNIGFKSYMPYTSITSKSSQQYRLQQIAYTGNYGIRMVDGRYCVAIGTYFIGDLSDCIGTYFDVVLQNGEIIPCILGDVKANQHTDQNNMYTVNNGCYTEFIVDSKALNSDAKRDGDVSSVKEEWDSPVEKIIVYEKNVFKED